MEGRLELPGEYLSRHKHLVGILGSCTNYKILQHGTGHGFGSFLNVHEGPHSFSSDVALVPGHVITNEPGFYNDGKWGIRIESALLVKKVDVRNSPPLYSSHESALLINIITFTRTDEI